LSSLPIVPPVLPACAKAAPPNGINKATAASMIAAQVNVRIGSSQKLIMVQFHFC
jgi:hypothetical protein